MIMIIKMIRIIQMIMIIITKIIMVMMIKMMVVKTERMTMQIFAGQGLSEREHWSTLETAWMRGVLARRRFLITLLVMSSSLGRMPVYKNFFRLMSSFNANFSVKDLSTIF